jgi:hypothetical protein
MNADGTDFLLQHFSLDTPLLGFRNYELRITNYELRIIITLPTTLQGIEGQQYRAG